MQKYRDRNEYYKVDISPMPTKNCPRAFWKPLLSAAETETLQGAFRKIVDTRPI